jgi:hypothetical protein
MRSYGIVTPRFWTAGSGRAIRGDTNAQLLALYLMTCPSGSMIGIFHLAIPTMCHETGLPEDEVRDALRVLEQHDFAHFDESEDLIWVPAMAQHQIGKELSETDNTRVTVYKALQPFAGHRFGEAFTQKYREAYKLGVPFRRRDRAEKTGSTQDGNPSETPSGGMATKWVTPSKALPSPSEAPPKPLANQSATPSEPLRDPLPTPSEPLLNPSRTIKQDQDQDQDQDQKQDLSLPTLSLATPQKAPHSVRESESFVRFWSTYPRKVGKDDARKAWVKAAKASGGEAALETACLEALRWQKTSDDWTKDGGKFIPHPSKYLNAGRWQDEQQKPAASVPYYRMYDPNEELSP